MSAVLATVARYIMTRLRQPEIRPLRPYDLGDLEALGSRCLQESKF